MRRLLSDVTSCILFNVLTCTIQIRDTFDAQRQGGMGQEVSGLISSSIRLTKINHPKCTERSRQYRRNENHNIEYACSDLAVWFHCRSENGRSSN